MRKHFYFLALLLISITGFAQVDSATVEIDTTEYVNFFKVNELEEIDELDFKKDTIVKLKEKRKKKRVYYGFKTKRGFVKTQKGKKTILETFTYLKVWQEPNSYIKDHYWYNIEKNKIETSKKYTKENSKILHGPYKKMIDDVIVEEGIYYIGTKHGRWVSYTTPKEYHFRTGDRDKKVTVEDEDGYREKIIIPGSDTSLTYQLLLSKTFYNRGFSKYAEVLYYDAAKEKIKEVIPYDKDKRKNGDYFYYFENGKIQLRGELINGVKVGKWTEYQIVRGKVKRLEERLYPKFPVEKNPKGELYKLWNKRGSLIYDQRKGLDKREEDKKKNK